MENNQEMMQETSPVNKPKDRSELPLGKRILHTALILLITFLLMALGELLGSGIAYPLTASSNAGIAFGGRYASFIGFWIMFIGFCLIFKNYRDLLPKLGPKERGNKVLPALGAGLVLGMGLNLVVACAALLNKDIVITYAGFDVLMILYFIVAVGIQSGAEEVISRWFIYENVKKLFPKTPAVPIVVNSLFFVALHLGNEGLNVIALINLFLVGVMYSLLVYYFNSLWAAMVAHASWNFCQNILLGLPNSGIVTNYSVFSLDAANARDSFAYSTGFGIEGSVLACIVLALGCVVLFLLGRKKRQGMQHA